MAHAMQLLEENENHRVIIHWPSGDTGILVLTISVLCSHKTRIFLENSSGKERKSVWLGVLELSQQRSTSLIGLHAFSGMDYVSPFFKKGKDQFWKLLEKFEKFHDCFSSRGVQYEVSEEWFKQLEEIVCYLYGMRIKSVNEVGWKLFEKKHKRENKIADLSSPPPCQEVLRYHCQRANYVAYIWRHSFRPMRIMDGFNPEIFFGST